MNKNKSGSFFRSIVPSVAFLAAFIFVFILVGSANAASTIGTNMLTTGTLEVQNTASAAYLLSGNTIQVGGHASVAYSRFGTTATSHAGSIAAADDVMVSGDLEVNGSVAFDGHSFFAGAASFSLEIQLGDGRFQPQTDATTAVRFQNAAGDTSVLTIDTTNLWVGIGTTPTTKFEVQGTASASYFLTTNTIQVGGGTASVAYNRFGTTATSHAGSIAAANDVMISGDLEVDGSTSFDGQVMFNTASVNQGFEVSNGNTLLNKLVVGSSTASASGFTAEFTKAGSTSIYIGPTAGQTVGTCLEMKDTTGALAYVRINGTAFVINSISCK